MVTTKGRSSYHAFRAYTVIGDSAWGKAYKNGELPQGGIREGVFLCFVL